MLPIWKSLHCRRSRRWCRPRKTCATDDQGPGKPASRLRCAAHPAGGDGARRRRGAARSPRRRWPACIAAPCLRRSGGLGHADRRRGAPHRAYLCQGKRDLGRRGARTRARDLRGRDRGAVRSRHHQRDQLGAAGPDMPVNILMPALSPTMEKGNLARWLKQEGDTVKAGDVIAEIETDKATMEYEAIDDGVIAKIVVPEGTQDVAVNQLIAVLAQEGEDPKAAAAGAGKGSPPPPKAVEAAPAKQPPAQSGNVAPAPQAASPAPRQEQHEAARPDARGAN